MYSRQNVRWAKCMVGIMYGGQNVIALHNVYLSGQISKIEYCVNLK